MINGIQVKMARSALGIGVRELAKEAGINPNTVSRFETGGGIQASSLEKIEKALLNMGNVSFINEGENYGVMVNGEKVEE